MARIGDNISPVRSSSLVWLPSQHPPWLLTTLPEFKVVVSQQGVHAINGHDEALEIRHRGQQPHLFLRGKGAHHQFQ